MKLYQTDRNGYYVGEVIADVDPLDSTRFLIPKGCVPDAPIEVPEWAVPRWVDGQWIGEQVPEEVDYESAPITEDQVRSQRDWRLSQCDWTQLPDSPVEAEDWALYRQQLRDVTLQVGFPEEVVWPEEPSK
jgi:hypothetical protein